MHAAMSGVAACLRETSWEKSKMKRLGRPCVPTLVLLLILLPFAQSAHGQASTQGQWQTLPYTMPINPVHVALLYNGKVVIVSGSGNVAGNTNFQAALWDPQAGTITTQPVAWDMFCNGMVVLPDGRPFVMGGTLQYDPFHGELSTSTYDPATNTFTTQQSMAHGRWYPTSTVLGDGRTMIFSGLDENGSTNTSVEFYSASSGWSTAFAAPWTPPLYPRMHLLPNGNVFYSGSTTGSSLFNPSTNTWTTNIAFTNYSGTRTYGSSVLLPLTPANNYAPKVMIMGGGSPSTATTELIDLSANTPKWVNGPNMSQPRIEMNATILPNGRVLALGGSLNDEDTATASLNADLYNPSTNTFSSAGAEAYARLYHSVSLLLPDATVWVAGGNPARGTYEAHMEIYSPPYLFNSNGTLATRPTITSVSSGSLGYGSAFQVQTPDAANITSVVLMRNGAVTHAFDMDQRYVGLSFSVGSGVLNVTGPPNGNIAPPGYYMLFILNNSGVPSVASIVRVSVAGTDIPPTGTITNPASNETITAGQSVSYSGTGTDPDGTISGYSWSFPGGTPSSSLLANAGNVTYTNPGVYVTTFTVTDNAGLSDPHPPTRTITVQVPVPTVTGISPSTGPVAGGTAVTITGTNFAAGATVTFGGAAATNVVVVSGTQVTATTPAGSVGAATVTVTVNGQSGSLANGFNYNTAVAISFGQVAAATPQSSTATVPVTFPGAQTAGDLNIVVVGWNDTTAAVQSVKDTAGNTYNLAIGPTSGTALQQSIYYAANIVGGSNTVTVTFTQAAAYPDIRILEYHGVTTLDAKAGASGNSTAANSGSATTTSANELIFGANTVYTGNAAAGSGFTSRIITSPDGDIAEDKLVTTAGSNSATATLSSTGPWVMQMVTFSATTGPAPSVSSVSPNNGPTAGGTAVTITGTNFAAGATVTIGGAAATNVTVVSGTQITATTPAGSAGAATVTVTVNGQAGSLANAFTYIAPPTVTSVSPSTGPIAGGTAVTITGTNFATGATVTIGGTAATNVVVVSGTQITATTPAGSAGAATVTVTVNGQSGSLTNGFTYVVPPTVSSVSPNTGTTAGGTAVTITGTNFATGATVTFGGTAATNVVVVSATQITATTPAGSAGAVTVTVTNPGVPSGSLANGFTYVVVPTITSISPNNGPIAGGTAVTITGTNFAAGATVTIGGTAATNVVVVSGTQITATTPAHAAGAVTVTVTVNSQSGSLTNGFTYNAPPTVSSVSPNNGPIAGGTAVTITGTNFATGATVTFGGTAATNVVVVSATQITATTPAGSAGAVTVTVTNPGVPGGSLANGFTYVVIPTVTSISPNNGPIAGGTAVTITGTNFAAGATVTIGGTAATNVAVVSGTQITATTPAHAAGAVTVTVTVNSQSGSLTNGFTYNAPPTVSSVSPNNGPVAGGTAVTITGTNFATGATVTFGGTAATNVVVVSGTQITATTPAGSVGAVTVTVTVNGQSGSLASGFTYNTAVAISFGQVAAATPQSSTATVPVTFPGAQTAGDLNIVVVGWNDTTAAVQSVKDTAGNTYNLAIGPTSGTALQQSIYYAAPIVGGSNTVTVTFTQAAAYPDIRILEYHGVTTLDAKAGASGNSTAANSGSATTTSANELIFGANTVYTGNAAAGSGFTSRIITSPDSDIAEDKLVTTAGSNSATATLSSTGPWVMQMITFK